MNLYIDIDGVLLAKRQQVPENGSEFIRFITEKFNCLWLTTHCRGGENKALEYLKRYYAQDTIQLLESIHATNWIDLKTEAINFVQPFIWLEDRPMQAEIDILKINQVENSLIVIDLARQSELKKVRKVLQQFVIQNANPI